MLLDHNTVRVAPICDTSKVKVWRVIGQGHVWTELLQTRLTVGTVTIGVDQTADCSEVTGLELGDCGTNLGDTADDLMSRNAWIDSRHCTPFITYLM